MAPDDRRKPPLALWRQGVAFWCLAVILAGLFTFQHFRILSGLGMVALTLLALLQANLRQQLRSLVRQKAYLGFLLIFLLHVLTLGYTDPEFYPQWWQGLVLKLPLLLLPLALGLLAPLPARWLPLLYYFFFYLVFLAALYSLGQYLLHYAEINQSYHRAGVMPTLVNHVRFSLMVAFAVLIGLRLCWQGFYWRHPRERTWMGGITLFLFVFLHVLAVRSGLLALYAVLAVGLAYYLLIKKQFRYGLVLALFLVLIPVCSYLFLPTFKEKIHYTVYDLAQWKEETKANNYSLTGRLYSYRVGVAVWRQSPAIGWGMGNMHQVLGQTYKSLFPEIRPEAYLIPHNQFLYYLGLLGGLGLIIFLGCFYYPLVACFRQADVLFGVHYFIITLSFLFEPTLETQVGLVYSLVFILAPLTWISRKAGEKR